MKMVMISADDYEKLLKVKEESETKIESYKQCIAGYESRIKELTEERDKLKDQYPEIIRLNNELKILKKQYTDLNNAYKSQKNELHKLTKSSDDTNDILRSQYSCLLKDYERVKLAREEAIKEIKSLNARLSQVATKVAKIYNNTIVDTHTLNTLVEDLKNYI